AMRVLLARDCDNEAPNNYYPASYAEKIVDELDPLGVDVEVIGEREMTNLGMGALLGVGQGSANESKMVIMKYYGSEDEDEDPICFVGKGVTFDTGGISLKPPASMHEMKYDMGGSAAVVGALKALALRKAKVNVVGIVGLVENMPGGNAQRPGDIVTTMSGQTVEVLNTDAEGRLVLCDCVWYLQENFKPKCVIDLATLTGAILISLANTYAGCFANNDELAKNLISSSLKTDEKLWRMPLHKEYNEMLKSPVADIANIGGERGMAGSSTAAHFIERFIKKDVKWAHLDIAGVAWNKKPTNPLVPFGGVGFGVRLLNQFVQDHYEQEK
ncbi:MAG: leucyl aminopeptidase, partial [Rickettsiaceae bacterium]|nr:leucyl aminopeptidase [Rickettsiaceae bacterium]